MSVTGQAAVSASQVRWLVEQACRAPSVHNSQPWRFGYATDRLELWADSARTMTASDPDGRELTLSCGAALYNLRLAAGKIGVAAGVTLLPDLTAPRLLARIALREGTPADADLRRQYAALIRRHTHRGRFSDKPLAADLAVYLQRCADVEGATLMYVNQPGQRRRVVQLAGEAEHELATNPYVRAEVARWSPEPGTPRRDGVPATAYPARPRMVSDDLPARDFDQGRGHGLAATDDSPPGVIAVLTTERDTKRDWLIAGQAMERALIRAAQDWAFAALDSQLVEVASVRSELRRTLGISGYPQIVMRLGYATTAAATPRRPVGEVLDLTTT